MRDVLMRGVAVASVLLLGACGGGGGVSEPDSTPAPPSAFPLKTTSTFQAIPGHRYYRRDPATNIVTTDRMGVSGRDQNVTINYNAADGSYTVSDGTYSANLGPQGITSGHNDSYSKTVGTVSDKLELYNNVRAGTSGAPVQLTYLSYGIWSHSDSQTGNQRKTYLLFGYPTADSSMPRTGSATYQTAVTGNMLDIAPGGGLEREVGGSASFSANFGAGTVSTVLNLVQVNGPAIGTFNGTGAIYGGNQFNGNFTSSVPFFHSGDFMGGFFGPSAAEMGYNFYIRRYNPDPYAGASPNPVDQWILGSVVGKKN